MKKLFKLLLVSLISLSLVACSRNNNQDLKDELIAKFDYLMEEQFKYDLQNSAYVTYYLLENPQNYGIDVSKQDICFAKSNHLFITKEEFIEDNKYIYEALKFNSSYLREDQRDLYDSLKFVISLNEDLLDEKYQYYHQEFTQNANPANQTAQAIFDLNLRNEDSVKFLLGLIDDSQNYIEGIIDYAKVQLEKHTFISNIDYISEYTKNLINSDTDELLAGIYRQIDELGLNESYKEEIAIKIDEIYKPSLEKIVAFLDDENTKNNLNTDGLASLEYGAQYFGLLLKQTTGTDLKPDDYYKYVANEAVKYMMDIATLMSESPGKYDEFIDSDMNVELDFNSYEEILTFIKERMDEDFPKIDDLNYDIYDVNQALIGEGNIIAYYWQSPIDSSGVEQMRINPKYADIKSLSTYTTVAHEGLPGHMYAHNYMKDNLHANYSKALGDFNPSFSEGYANYVSYFVTDYLDNQNIKIIKNNELATNLIILLADSIVNYQGATKEELKQFFDNVGFGLDDEVVDELYMTMLDSPLMFAPYYFGWAKIEEYKADAMKKMGDKFSNREFHNVLLKTGNAPFKVIERAVNEYIANS